MSDGEGEAPRARFGDLRSALFSEPDQRAWERVCALIDTWPDAQDAFDSALPYARSHLARWPVSLREPTTEARDALIAGRPLPSLGLCLRLPLSYHHFHTGDRITNRALTALAASPWLFGVEEIDLASHPIGDAALRAIAASPYATSVTHLTLDYTCATHAGVDALLRSKPLENLSCLSTSNLNMGDEVARAAASLAASGARLRRLDMVGNRLSDVGAKALASAPALASLEHLDLSFNEISDEGAFALANSPHLGAITRLVLDYNDVGLSGWRALVHSPNFARARVTCYPVHA